MVHKLVVCPYCQGERVVKRGKTDTGKQRSRCQDASCCPQSFLRDPASKGRLPESKQQVIEMSLNGSGIRDTTRVLQISTATGINELKKKAGSHLGEDSPHKRLTTRGRRGKHQPSGGRGGR